MNQKLKLISIKKAYLQIDFAFAIFIFLFFFFIIYSHYINALHSYDLSLKDSNYVADSRDVCKLLITSSGVPDNWEVNLSKLKTLGLLKINKSFIDSNKISIFTSTNYMNLSNSLNIKKIVNIKIIGLNTNTNYVNFGFNTINHTPNIYHKYTCYSNYNNLEPVKIQIEVWN